MFKSPRFHNQSSQNTTFQTKGFPYSVIVRPLKESLSEALLRPLLILTKSKMLYINSNVVLVKMFEIEIHDHKPFDLEFC